MQVERDIAGLWFLPGNDDARVGGILHYNRDTGLLLQFNGQLLEHRPFDRGPIEAPVILGISALG